MATAVPIFSCPCTATNSIYVFCTPATPDLPAYRCMPSSCQYLLPILPMFHFWSSSVWLSVTPVFCIHKKNLTQWGPEHLRISLYLMYFISNNSEVHMGKKNLDNSVSVSLSLMCCFEFCLAADHRHFHIQCWMEVSQLGRDVLASFGHHTFLKRSTVMVTNSFFNNVRHWLC